MWGLWVLAGSLKICWFEGEHLLTNALNLKEDGWCEKKKCCLAGSLSLLAMDYNIIIRVGRKSTHAICGQHSDMFSSHTNGQWIDGENFEIQCGCCGCVKYYKLWTPELVTTGGYVSWERHKREIGNISISHIWRQRQYKRHWRRVNSRMGYWLFTDRVTGLSVSLSLDISNIQ